MTEAISTQDSAGAISVFDDGAPRWTYQYAARRRPFLHPVRTPQGTVLTIDAPDDHPWHHGLWFTIKFVNDENFWEEYDEYGVLRHDAPPIVTDATAGSGVSIRGALSWIRPDRRTVVIHEDRRLTHVPIDDRSYAIDVDTTLVPTVDVVLDRTPFTTWGGYGGLAFRGRPDLRDTEIRLAGSPPTDRVEGVPAAWLDLSGNVDGHPVGLSIYDAPGNPSHPVPWYASTRHATYALDDTDGWSNFVNAAFLFHHPLHLADGTPMTFRYRVVIHDGGVSPAALQRGYELYRQDRTT